MCDVLDKAEQRGKEIGKELGKAEERQNTERERARAVAAEEKLRAVEAELLKMKKALVGKQ